MARGVDTEGVMTSRFTKTVVLGALAAVGALAWSGCGSSGDGRYYCDTGGCYSCDAYGCTQVHAPSKPACKTSATCASGTVCTTNGVCSATCNADAQCPKGETCQTGLCSEPGTPPGTVIPTPDGGTPDGGDGGSNPNGCGTGPACAAPNVCVSGACTAPQNACNYTSECAAGKICADGACLTPCDNGHCADGYTCEKNVCQPNAVDPNDGGTTQPTTCTDDPSCGTGKYCNNGICADDNRPKPNCTIDDDCHGTAATPKKCLAGYCKYTCTSDQYCRTIDSRIGVCAKDNVCRSSSEAAAQCTGPGTCPLAGQSCIDNQCK